MTFCSRGGSDAMASCTRLFGLLALVGHVRPLGLRGDERGGQRRFVEMVVVGQRRGRLDGVDADDGAAQALLVGAHLARRGRPATARSPSSRRSSSRAASSSRRWRRTPRGQASLRSASIMAPRMRRSAKVSNLMPRASSKRCAASIRPMTPSWTRSPMSIECGMVAATRRASCSTNGMLATTRGCL